MRWDLWHIDWEGSCAPCWLCGAQGRKERSCSQQGTWTGTKVNVLECSSTSAEGLYMYLLYDHIQVIFHVHVEQKLYELASLETRNKVISILEWCRLFHALFIIVAWTMLSLRKSRVSMHYLLQTLVSTSTRQCWWRCLTTGVSPRPRWGLLVSTARWLVWARLDWQCMRQTLRKTGRASTGSHGYSDWGTSHDLWPITFHHGVCYWHCFGSQALGID